MLEYTATCTLSVATIQAGHQQVLSLSLSAQVCGGRDVL